MCETCSPKRRRTPSPSATVVALPSKESAGLVADATRTALESAERLSTPAGAACMVLAERIDVGQDSGGALAAMVKQLVATLADATRGTKVAASPVDDLRARRDRKRAQ